ncbi:MAG: TlpA disulfide reductase family protein, partial [Caldimonas sp.]
LSFSADTQQKLPSLAFTTLEGPSRQLDAFVGKPTVVNLWATWCPPCVREMPMLQQAQAQRPDVNFVFLNQGESRAQVSAWLKLHGLPLDNVLLDDKRAASAAFQQKGYPTTMFFQADGSLVSVRLGELSAATLSDKLSLIAKVRTLEAAR